MTPANLPSNCVVMGVGDYDETDGGPEDIGNVDPQDPLGGDDWWEPPDEPGDPPEPPNIPDGPIVPDISFPNINITAGKSPYLVDIPDVDLYDVPGTTLTYTPKFVLATPDHSSVITISEQELEVTGPLQTALEDNGLGTIKAWLKSMDYPSELYFELEIPDSESAMVFYQENSRLLDKLQVGAEYEIVYFTSYPGSNLEIVVSRYLGSFLVNVNISLPAAPDVIHQWNGNCPPVEPCSPCPECDVNDPFVWASYRECYDIVTTDTSICAGAAYTTGPIPPFTPRPRRLGYKNYQSITKLPLSSEEEAKWRLLTDYGNGILNQDYSFIRSYTHSPILPIPSTLTSIFYSLADANVKEILNINNMDSAYSDYPYNALNNNKIGESLREEVLEDISTSYSLNGTSLSETLLSAFRRSLIRNEHTVYTRDNIREIKTRTRVTKPVEVFTSQTDNNIEGVNLLLSEGVSLDPLATDSIKVKNRLFNWKILAEDINKRVVYKTAKQEETLIYIPNNETLTVFTSDGTKHTLGMQDGDYFVADPLIGNKRLTVFSDRDKAIVYNPVNEAKIAKFLNVNMESVLDASSDTSALTEYNVDVSTAREDWYFLKLDKDTIVDLPIDNYLLKKTKATYASTRIQSEIDAFVKHNAFPGLVVHLNHDDMFFNHLEDTDTATFTHTDFTFDYFSTAPDKLIARRLPQHIVVIPTDKVINNISQGRSVLVDFNTRKVALQRSPIDPGRRGTTDHPYLLPEYDQVDVVNFTEDRVKNMIWQEKIKYVFDTSKVDAIEKYIGGTEPLPRATLPAAKLFKELNNIKTTYSLTDRDFIQNYDLYSRLNPYDFRGIFSDISSLFNLKPKLRLNKITDDDEFNKNTFVKVKETIKINEKEPVFLPTSTKAPIIFHKQKLPKGQPIPAIPISPVPATTTRSGSGLVGDDDNGGEESGPGY